MKTLALLLAVLLALSGMSPAMAAWSQPADSGIVPVMAANAEHHDCHGGLPDPAQQQPGDTSHCAAAGHDCCTAVATDFVVPPLVSALALERPRRYIAPAMPSAPTEVPFEPPRLAILLAA